MNYSQPVSGTGLKKSAQLDFENTAEAYRSKTTQELLRHFVVFSTFTFAGIVNRSHKVIQSLTVLKLCALFVVKCS